MDIPITEFSNMLGVDSLPRNFGFLVKLVVVKGDMRFWIWKNVFELLQSAN